MNASEVIAIVSVVVAFLALPQSWRAGHQAAKAGRESNVLFKQQVALQDRLAQIEQSREHAESVRSLQAVLRAELRRTGINSWRLLVMNKGQGTARNLAITLDSKPLLEHPVFSGGQEEAKLIGPESSISYCISVSHGCAPPFELVATWGDDSGQQGQYSTTVTF